MGQDGLRFATRLGIARNLAVLQMLCPANTGSDCTQCTHTHTRARTHTHLAFAVQRKKVANSAIAITPVLEIMQYREVHGTAVVKLFQRQRTHRAMPSWGQRTWALACCILLGVASADHETSTTGALNDWKSQCSTQGSPTKIKVQVRVRGPAAEELQSMRCPCAACIAVKSATSLVRLAKELIRRNCVESARFSRLSATPSQRRSPGAMRSASPTGLSKRSSKQLHHHPNPCNTNLRSRHGWRSPTTTTTASSTRCACPRTTPLRRKRAIPKTRTAPTRAWCAWALRRFPSQASARPP